MGARNIEANSILFYVLNQGLFLADAVGDDSVSPWKNYASAIKQAAYDGLWDPEVNLYRDNDTRPLTDLHSLDGNAWAVVSGLTVSAEHSSNISAALAARWGKYGAPAPDAGETVLPFISGFELQVHYAAGHPERAVRLMKRMWGDFMLDDPQMTNSTFIEGYSTNGDLHYAPYNNDPRISHAHGWVTGPTSALTYYAAGLQILTASGKTWTIAPSLVGLKNDEAGCSTNLGTFSPTVTTGDTGLRVRFETPRNTTGSLNLESPSRSATLSLSGKQRGELTLRIPGGGRGRFETSGLAGGSYQAELRLE